MSELARVAGVATDCLRATLGVALRISHACAGAPPSRGVRISAGPACLTWRELCKGAEDRPDGGQDDVLTVKVQ